MGFEAVNKFYWKMGEEGKGPTKLKRPREGVGMEEVKKVGPGPENLGGPRRETDRKEEGRERLGKVE